MKDIKIIHNVKPRVPHKYNVGEIINGQKILEKIYIIRNNKGKEQKVKGYEVQCLKCTGTSHKPERQIDDNVGCGICRGFVVVAGINDVATTHPELVKFFKNPEDAKTVTYSSCKKKEMICPYCGKSERIMTINNLYKWGYSCPICSNNISYPEKFIGNFLKQCNVKFIPQASNNTFVWCNNYRYDFYIPEYNMIIEAHGKQHYEDNKGSWNITLDEQKNIDLIKQELAIANGIKHYIILDCRESEMDWIKKSIETSKIIFLLNIDLNKVNWDKIQCDSLKSDVLKVCEMWNENKDFTTMDIANQLNLSQITVTRYLHKGSEVGLCDYSCNEGKKRGINKNSGELNPRSKKVFYNNVIYCSIREFSNVIGVHEGTVRGWLVKDKKLVKENKYLAAHYATEEEIEKYPRFKIDD